MRLQALHLALRTRLALLYTSLLVIALIVFGGGLYLVLDNALSNSFNQALLDNAKHARGAFAADVGPNGQLDPSPRLLAQFAATGGRVEVLSPTGTILADSAPGAAAPMPIGAGDLALAARNEHGVREISVEGDIKRLTIEPIDSTSGQLVGYVAWAESTSPLRDLLRTVSIALVVGGLLVVLLAFAAGWRLARRALAPVVEVTDTARAISLSGDFAARVETGPPGDEIGELAVAFNEMLAALAANHQALQRFFGDASHQLRTPLTTIRASLDLAQRPGLDETERRAILADAQAEAGRMARLIGDLLSLARADAGVRLSFQPVEIDAVLLECVREQRQAAQHVRMTVKQVAPSIVDGDRDRLKELFLILLENAARYTPAGGTVSTSLEVRDGRVTIGVADTGIGIDEADRGHLFERLYRGRRAREMRPAGTGLGLAIAHWIAEAHGGTISLEPRRGGGTLAMVTLPERTP
ncbi:MAG: HAMP domain-containing sensor histidine kinase [Chloroflexi bacterium]|nr:HAMP domain-containing sensor histidine kinase [Chloroflexota bacterium]